MGQMLVRNLDDAVIGRLKQKALERGTSLTQAARVDDRAAWAARAAALRAQTRLDPDFDTVAVIRAWRDGDPLARLREERDAGPAATKAKEA